MQIVINIPEIGYDIISVRKRNCNTELENLLIDTILNGKILPKGHGRLIDADKLNIPPEEMVAKTAVQCAPTVIGADEEVEE